MSKEIKVASSGEASKSLEDRPVGSYDEYSKKFMADSDAVGYHQSHSLGSFKDLLKPSRVLGWVVAKAEEVAVRRLLRSCKGEIVLDVPCGTGKIMTALARRGHQVVGLDTSAKMLAQIAGSEKELTELLVADIRRIPLRDSSVDVVLCNRFLHRIDPSDHRRALNEIRRVGKQYAILYFAVKGVFANCVFRLERTLDLGNRGLTFYLTRNEIRDELETLGWTLVRATSVIPFLSTGYVVLASPVTTWKYIQRY